MTLAHCLVPCPYCPTARLPTPPWLLIGVKLVLPPVEAESMRLCDYTANLTDCFGPARDGRAAVGPAGKRR